MKRKYQQFFYELLWFKRELTEIKEVVKASIGDSVDNNRTLTVNQVIRFLKNDSNRYNRKFGKQLEVVYNDLRKTITYNRISSRKDAVDLNEFVKSYRTVIMNEGLFRNEIGKLVGKVG